MRSTCTERPLAVADFILDPLAWHTVVKPGSRNRRGLEERSGRSAGRETWKLTEPQGRRLGRGAERRGRPGRLSCLATTGRAIPSLGGGVNRVFWCIFFCHPHLHHPVPSLSVAGKVRGMVAHLPDPGPQHNLLQDHAQRPPTEMSPGARAGLSRMMRYNAPARHPMGLSVRSSL